MVQLINALRACLRMCTNKHNAKSIHFQTLLNLSRMSCEEEVISVRKQLEKMSKEGDDQTQALDLLKSLGKLPINLQVLTNTRCRFGCDGVIGVLNQ